MKILIVDDITTNRKLLGAILEAEGHALLEAQDGLEALDILEHQPVEAIISDILMPRMDGYQLCHDVRETERLCHLPFIFYTSTYISASDQKLALAMGADQFLVKPATAKEINQALQKAVQTNRHPAPVTEPDRELILLKEYNQQLVAKLVKKNDDLTARNLELVRSAEKLLLQSTALENAANAIVITNTDGVMQWANPAFIKLTGYGFEELIGKSMGLLKSGKHDQAFYHNFWTTILSGKTWHGNFMNRRKDGTLYEEEQTITPVRTGGNEITHFISIINDLTEHRQLEAKFLEAQKMEVVGHLAGGVAHDFNNVLAIVMGYADLIKQDLADSDPLQKYVEEICHASRRAAGLTQQLLIFSRKETILAVEMDLNEVVRDMDKMLRQLINENVELTLLCSAESITIKADSGYIWQLLMNLVINARDAMLKGGKITIRTSRTMLDESQAQAHPGRTAGAYAMLSVSDTGVGMSDEVKDHLFQAFFTTKPAGKGTGLGLVTCQTIVKQSGGYIDVMSEVGVGTTFTVHFPLVASPVGISAKTMIEKGPDYRGSETVLVVEDEPSLRHLTQEIMENLGYEVLTASNGQEALNLVRNHQGTPISIVITDVVMPRMGGHVMAEWLKAIYPDLKVLFTSGYSEDAISHHGTLSKGVELLPKPYSAEALGRKVRELLDAAP